MRNSLEIKILNRIQKAGRGVLFSAGSFTRLGDSAAVRKALERLVKAGELKRAARGFYVRPAIDSVIGDVMPGIDEIAKAAARRDRARIIPTGIYALNRLGLSTQIPMNVVYLTDGAARKIKIDGRIITFKKTTPKNLAAIGRISGLAIQALRAIGKKNITETDVKTIQQLLRKEKEQRLEHDMRLAPEWIREIFRPILNEAVNERGNAKKMVTIS